MVDRRVGTTSKIIARKPSPLDAAGSLNPSITSEGAPQTASTFGPSLLPSSSATVTRSSFDTSSYLTSPTAPSIDPSQSNIPAPAAPTASSASSLLSGSPSKATIAGIAVATTLSVLIILVLVYMVHRFYRKSRSRSQSHSHSPEMMGLSDKGGDRKSVSIESLQGSESHASCNSDTCSEDGDSLLAPTIGLSTSNVARRTSLYQAVPSSLWGNGSSDEPTAHYGSPRLRSQSLPYDTDCDGSLDLEYLSCGQDDAQMSHVTRMMSISSSPKPYRCHNLSSMVDNYSNGPTPIRPGGPPSYSKSPYLQTFTPSDVSIPLPPYSSPKSRSPWTSTQSFKNETVHAQHETDWTRMHIQTSQGARSLYEPLLSPPAPPPPFSPPAIPSIKFQQNLRKYHANQSQNLQLPKGHAHRTRASTISVINNPVSPSVHLYSTNKPMNNLQPFQVDKPLLKLDVSDMNSDSGPRLARHKSMITHNSASSSPLDSLMSAPPTGEPQLRRHLSCLSPRATGLPLRYTMSSRTTRSHNRPISNAATRGSTLSPLSPSSSCLTDCTEFSEDSRERDSRYKPSAHIEHLQVEMPYAAKSVPKLSSSTHNDYEVCSQSSSNVDESSYNSNEATDFFQDDGIAVPFLFRLPINPRSSSLPRPSQTPKPKPKRLVLDFGTHSVEM